MKINRFIKYAVFFTGLSILIVTGSMQVMAAEPETRFWMPRTTLQNDLNVYASPDSSSHVEFKAKQGQALREVGVSGNWIEVQWQGFEGYAYSNSVVKYKYSSDWLFNKIINEVTYFAYGDILFILTIGKCFTLPMDVIRGVDENKKTLQQHLDSVGGLRPLTVDEQEACFSDV